MTHPQGRPSDPTLDDAQGVDPVELLRAMLAISTEDAASAREDAAEAVRSAAVSAQRDEDRADAVPRGQPSEQ